MTKEDEDVPSTKRRYGRVLLCISAVAMAVSVGCSGDEPRADPVTTQTSVPTSAATTSTPTTVVDPKEKDKENILAVLNGYWTEYAAATDPPDGERPSLLLLLADPLRSRITENLREMRSNGYRARRVEGGPLPHSISSFEVTGDEIQTLECVIDDAVTYDSSNAVVNSDVVSIIYRTTVSRQPSGRWAISDRARETKVPGRTACPGL